MRYVDQAAVLRARFGEPHPRIPEELTAEVLLSGLSRIGENVKTVMISATPTGIEASVWNTHDRVGITADRPPNPPAESPRFETARDESRPVEIAGGAEPSAAELERAILDAVAAGALDVARVLASRLEARRRVAKVIDSEEGRATNDL
jgi:hypothetical protein